MAEPSPSPAATAEPNQAVPSPPPPPKSTPSPLNPNPNPSPITPPPPPQIPAMFRPPPQFSLLPVQPPGVGNQPPPGMMPPPIYAPVSGQQMLPRPPFAPMPNGFPGMPHMGIPRYGPPYNPMVRPQFFPRPPGVPGPMPPLNMIRPPIGIRGPLPAVIRPPVIGSVTPIEKPQTTVYVGKIASTVENDFILSLLQLCGPVKSWKRAQNPSNGTHKGFGFCEFESTEGVLRAMRLLSKLNIDGQELMINVNQATKEYLVRYVEKKAVECSKKLKEAENVEGEKEEDGIVIPNAEKNESPKPSEESKKEDRDAGSERKIESANFGITSDEEREADRELLEKLTGMIEVRLKNNPLPPPPPLPPADSSNIFNSEQQTESKDGEPNVDDLQNGEDKRDEEMTHEAKPSREQEIPDSSSPNRSRRDDRRSKDRERDKRDKERELERYERDRELDRTRREREREYKSKEDDRRYKLRVKEWESRERDKEYVRKQDKEKEKEREYQRKQDVLDQEMEEDDDDDDYRKRKHKSYRSEERKRRIREKEDDFDDRLREEEEVAEAKKREEEELQKLKEREKCASEPLPDNEINGIKGEIKNEAVEMTDDGDSENENHTGDGISQNGDEDKSVTENISTSDMQQNNNISSKKLEFGIVGSGKRSAVPSVFIQEEDEDAHKDKKMRPLVPIDYSTEELQAVQSSTPFAPPSNLAAAAEYAKQISGISSKEERGDVERERSRRSHDRSRDRDRNGDEAHRAREENRKEERVRDREKKMDKKKTENQKLLDAKQLIDMIPKTKDDLFSYNINWVVYEKNELHNRMKPWISKKITEFLGEEEPTLVDYIVSSTHEHVTGGEMLDRLQSILDDEAEMFVLKMWRMLIFEIKKIETGLAQRATS